MAVDSQMLACPDCAATVVRRGETLRCQECRANYPIVGGRPILIGKSWGQALREEVLSAAHDLPPRHSVPDLPGPGDGDLEEFFFSELFPRLDRRDPEWKFLAARVREMVGSIESGHAVLDVGAGESKYGSLLRHANYTSTDLVSSSQRHNFSHVDVVGDALHLPFASATFDAVLSLVVFEHVSDPWTAARELSRVTKSGGQVFALIPLVRPEHLVPHDFHRFTQYGIHNMFRQAGLKVVRIQASNGSLWTAVRYLRETAMSAPILRYGRRSLAGMALNRFWWAVLLPLVWYGRWTNRTYPRNFPIYYWVTLSREP